MSAGYSGTPVPKKLGFKDTTQLVTIDAPDDYGLLTGPFPAGLERSERVSKTTNFVHLFATKKAC